MNRFWLSWMHDPLGPNFELHSPWWRSGVAFMSDDSERHCICAAVEADDEDGAMAKVLSSYDRPPEITWRFCEPRANDWSPFGDRFRRADWMKWPSASPT